MNINDSIKLVEELGEVVSKLNTIRDKYKVEVNEFFAWAEEENKKMIENKLKKEDTDEKT